MKKFLIVIIFLIPVIIFLAIQGAGSAIEAWAPAVNAERIEIKDQYNHTIQDGKLVMPRYTYDGDDGVAYIYINVYPSIAFSDEIHYTISQEADYTGDCVMEKVENSKYRITAKRSGDVLLRIHSATNDNAYAMLNVYITSEYINDLAIYSQKEEGSQRHKEGDEIDFEYGVKFYAFAHPVEAVGENTILWESADKQIAIVDANGKITPQGVGRVKITATLKDKTNTEHFTFVFVNVLKDIIFKKEKVFLDRKFFTQLDRYEKEKFIFNNLTVEDKENPIGYDDVYLIENDDDLYIYEVRGRQIFIELIDKDELQITSDYLNELYLDNGGYSLIVEYIDFNSQLPDDISYHVSNKNILEIKNNRIIPKCKGVCDIYARDGNGKKTQTIRLVVKERPISFQLNYTNLDNLKGIQQKRVWGMNWLDNKTVTNTYNLGYDELKVYPQDADVDLFWEIDNCALASIDQKGNITFKPECVGEEITVTATVMVHNILTDMQRSYTFEMVDDTDAINVYTREEFIKTLEKDNLQRPAVLQSDLDMKNDTIEIANSIYGNGYFLRFAFDKKNGANDAAISVKGENIDETLEKLVYENFSIQCSDKYKKGEDKGNAIYIKELNTPITIKNIISRYAWNSIHLVDNNAEITVEGCILGNAGFAAIYITHRYYDKGAEKDKIILKNLVFRETNCASLVFAPRSADTDISNKNYVPDIVFEGFIDSYNWKKTKQIKAMFESLDDSLFGNLAPIRNILNKLITELLDNILADKKNSRIVYIDEEGEEWVSMNMFSLGTNQYIDPESFIFKGNKDFETVPVLLPSTIISALKFLKYNLDNPCYFMVYKFDEENGPRIKPKDACPENEELFSRLRGG